MKTQNSWRKIYLQSKKHFTFPHDLQWCFLRYILLKVVEHTIHIVAASSGTHTGAALPRQLSGTCWRDKCKHLLFYFVNYLYHLFLNSFSVHLRFFCNILITLTWNGFLKTFRWDVYKINYYLNSSDRSLNHNCSL